MAMEREQEAVKRTKDFRKIISIAATLAFVGLVVYILTISLFIVSEWDFFTVIIYFLLQYSILCQIALPFMSHAWAYNLYLPASIFGLWMSILFWLNRFGVLQHPLSFGVASVPAIVVLYSIHRLTRKGFFFFSRISRITLHLDLGTLTRIGSPVVAPLLIFVNMVFSMPQIMERNPTNTVMLICFLLFLYSCYSVANLNFTYRGKLLSDRLKVRDYRKKLAENEQKLAERHEDNLEQAEFFSFLVRSAATDFVYGYYERSFLDNYRVIHDEILRPQRDIRGIMAERLTDEKREELRRMRVFLVHGMLKEKPSWRKVPIKVEDVFKGKKQLFTRSLELVELAFYLTKRI